MTGSKQVQNISISCGAIVLAAAFLTANPFIIGVGIAIVVLLIGLGVGCRLLAARFYLPDNPVEAVSWFNGVAVAYIGLGILLGSIPITAGAALPKELEYPASAAILGAVAALVVVKAAETITVDGEAIDKQIGKTTKKAFTKVYKPMFEAGTLKKEIPAPPTPADPNPTGTILSRAYIALTLEEFGDGWTKSGRELRAKALNQALAERTPESPRV